MSPQQNSSRDGTVHSLQICPGYRKPMQILDRVDVVENLGISKDKHALRDSSRQILLLEKETLDDLGLLPGQVKENITTAGIDLMKLKYGQQLKIGPNVILEVTKACSPCSRMEEIRPGLLKQLAGRRGMLARVAQGGIMNKGDSIQLLPE
jgi:MOSC domain-containing protein YiiM